MPFVFCKQSCFGSSAMEGDFKLAYPVLQIIDLVMKAFLLGLFHIRLFSLGINGGIHSDLGKISYPVHELIEGLVI